MHKKVGCPVPRSGDGNIMIAHGGGGRLMHRLIEEVFMPAFDNRHLNARHDGAIIDFPGKKLAYTTDSYVVAPLFFSGGDIGSLAVNGTVNDLAMCGARPLYMSAGFIIEEGFSIESLKKIVESMRLAADKSGIQIVTGDTKVVDKGKGDQIFINTSGVGLIEHSLKILPSCIEKGDIIIVNGDLGRHGTAIMADREGFEFDTEIQSDCAPLARSVLNLIEAEIEIHCLRDLTRGGLASAVVEIAEMSKLHIKINESALPVSSGVKAACEILGLDPVYVANEGRFISFLPEKDGAKALKVLKQLNWTQSSAIGRVTDQECGKVTIENYLGIERKLNMISGEQLPRIC